MVIYHFCCIIPIYCLMIILYESQEQSAAFAHMRLDEYLCATTGHPAHAQRMKATERMRQASFHQLSVCGWGSLFRALAARGGCRVLNGPDLKFLRDEVSILQLQDAWCLSVSGAH